MKSLSSSMLAVAFLVGGLSLFSGPFLQVASAEEISEHIEETVFVCHEGETKEIEFSTLAEHILSGDSEGKCEDVEQEIVPHDPVLGGLRLCKIIIDEHGTIAESGADIPEGTFSISVSRGSSPESASLVESVMWDTEGFSVNTDLFKDDEKKDASCITIDTTVIDSYYYTQEVVSGSSQWSQPTYNDQNTVTISSLSDFYPYSGELFTSDPNDDAARNQNADGHVVLTNGRPERTIVILNRYSKEPARPECALEGYKYDHGGNPLAGWTIGVSNAYQCTDKNELNESFRETRVTDENGYYCFDELLDGQYTVYEAAKDGWDNVKVTVNGYERQGFSNSYFDAFVEVGLEENTTTKINFWNKELPKPECSDNTDNDGDGKKDYPEDLGCKDTKDNNENDRPIITVLPPNPMTVVQGSVFTDPGATAFDAEDGNITSQIITTGTVGTGTLGTYYLRYNVSDSDGLAAHQKKRTVGVVPPPASTKATVVATKIICQNEVDLPNQSGGVNIMAQTASTFLSEHPNCALAQNWKFQWGYAQVTDPGSAFLGETGGGWTSFGPTGGTGVATVEIPVSSSTGKIWVREALQDGYIPFAHPTSTVNPISAELYCHADVLNYDNYDFIADPIGGTTYHCVAWNVAKVAPPQCSDGIDNDVDGLIDHPTDTGCDTPSDNTENAKPVITVGNPNPMTVYLGATFADATTTNAVIAADEEDGNITDEIISTNTVNTDILGTYAVFYNVSDSDGLAADQKTRTVQIVSQCSDGIDNDGDGKIDIGTGEGNDSGCENTNDNNENNPPVITLLGTNPMNIIVNTVFTDPGAIASDPEEGALTPVVIGTVNANILGTYFLTYTATDMEGLFAQATRTVNVGPVNPECSDDIDNDEDDTVDYPQDVGCGSPEDNSENAAPMITLTPPNPAAVYIGAPFVDPGYAANDPEDGVRPVIVTGSVDTNVLGLYTLFYNATDTQGVTAEEKTRAVNVVSECSDGINNDADQGIDYPADLGCSSPEDNNENNPPIISLLGVNPIDLIIGTTFTDPGATAFDAEDGNITGSILPGGTVNTNALGTYTLTYDVMDSGGLSALQVTRIVNILPSPTIPECSDEIDNDEDGGIDFGEGEGNDPGCDGPNDDNERGFPAITLIGANPVVLTVGGVFSEPGATASDPEDGNISGDIVYGGSVNAAVVGAYTLTYDVEDSDGNDAPQVTRVVIVQSGGGGGGGGGVGISGLQIFNERLTMVSLTSAKITWNTNLLADSRVVHGPLSNAAVGQPLMYGYPSTTATGTILTSNHEVIVTGLTEGTVNFFRPVSSDSLNRVVGIELSNPIVAGSCTYLEKYLRIGYQNDPIEVTKLQRFLRDFEGFTGLPVTGYFDIETDKAVRAFQDKYAGEVLTPWGLPANTGYVYYTTKKKINEIYCQQAFPLDNAQLREIQEFVELMRRSGTIPGDQSDLSPHTSQPTLTITPNPVVHTVAPFSPVVEYSLPPVVTLVSEKPKKGEITSGIKTDKPIIETTNGRFTPSKLIAALPIKFGKDRQEEVVPSSTANGAPGSTTDERLDDATSTSLIAAAAGSIAGTLGVSPATFWVWLVLFAGIIVLGYATVRKNRQGQISDW